MNNDAYTEEEYIRDITKHIQGVQYLLGQFMVQLEHRAQEHDKSKLHNPEKDILRRHSHELDNCQYGDESYTYHLERVREAIQHHYLHNRHHPEHHQNGIRGMNLLDVVEMFFDWCVTAKKYGNKVEHSINVGQERFDMSDDLTQIFLNTARQFELI